MAMMMFRLSIYQGKPALGYKLGINILAGNLVWIQGLYSAGKYTKIKMFNKVCTHLLELQPGKRIEADEGYRSPRIRGNAPEMMQIQWRSGQRREG